MLFHLADMVDFDLGHQFDAIVCLFSSIGYTKTIARLNQALHTMRRHLSPGGVILIEPWLRPEMYKVGHIAAAFVNEPDLKIARMNKSELGDGVSIMNFHYLVATPEGIEYFTELHELGLFSHEEYLHAFRVNGLEVVYDADPEKLMGRGLYIGVLR